MANEIEDDGLIRRYLLRQLAEDERQQLEERIMTDNELYNRVLLAEDEMVEEYVRGELSESEREGFEASFLSTIEGRKQVSFEKALSSYVASAASSEGQAAKQPAGEETAGITGESAPAGKVIRPVWWRRPTMAPYLRMAAAAVLVVGSGLGIWRVFFFQSDVTAGTAALVQAYLQQRPLEARISGFTYAPAADTRGGQEKVDTVSHDLAANILLNAVAKHPTAASHHALGKFYLANRDFGKAIAQFDEALKTDPNNARLYSDYGTALLEKGKIDLASDQPGKSLEEFARALEHLTKALELDDNLLEALFNRALCHQYLVLRGRAEEDWRTYLQKDSSSNWGEEARRNLQLLEEQTRQTSRVRAAYIQEIISAYRLRDGDRAWQIVGENREVITGRDVNEQLLNAYIQLSAEGRQGEANESLQVLFYVSELAKEKAGDGYVSEVAQFYRRASLDSRGKLAKARQSMMRAQQLYLESRFTEALAHYAEAERVFSSIGDSAEALHMKLRAAQCRFQMGNVEQSISELDQVARECERKEYNWLLAQCFNLLARAAQAHHNESSKYIHLVTKSLELSEQTNDIYATQKCLAQLADEYQSLGSFKQSLDLLQRCLSVMSASWPGDRQAWRSYDTAAKAFKGLSLHSAARAYAEEAMTLAVEKIKDPSFSYLSHIALGTILAEEGKDREAIEYVQRGYEIASESLDQSAARDMRAYSSLRLGDIHRQAGNLAKALEWYDRSIRLHEDLSFQVVSYYAHRGRLRCYIVLGDTAAANAELEVTLALFEQYRSKILEESSRNSFFDREQDTYDLAVDFQSSRMNDPRGAFEYSERSRARSLLHLRERPPSELYQTPGQGTQRESWTESKTINELQADLPEQVQILQFSVLSDRVLIWVVGKTEFSSAETMVALPDLKEEVKSYLRLISSPTKEREVRSKATRLYQLLIERVEPFLDRRKQLCIVPDKFLIELPFGALVSSRSGTYLVGEYSILYAPSSTMFLHCTALASRKHRLAPERLLSVGNPSFDRTANPTLPDLPESDNEAREIAKCYVTSRVLTGDAAKESQVKREMMNSDVVHLAAHYVVNTRDPRLSSLLLASEASSPGALVAQDVYRMKFDRLRLVTLAACRTGVEQYYSGEGMIGFSRAFIAAGVPLVVASLWPVNSGSTAVLMLNYHRYRKNAGLPTIKALSLAQVEMSNSTESVYSHPYYWASFIAIGGLADF